MKNLFIVKSILVLYLFSHTGCMAQEDLKDLDVLSGTWKIENKATYESWIKISKTKFEGKSYKLNGTEEQITENLSIQFIEDKWVYNATVKNQNQGNTISFVLNLNIKELFSFENLEHDFPKKIQYKVITNDKLLVNVLGEDDKGFSYYLIKQ